MKPWLLIDIDGVLNPSISNSVAKKRGIRVSHAWSDGWKYRMLLNPVHGTMLLNMTDIFQLAWCTTWQDKANDVIRFRLGLPILPVVKFDWTKGSSKVSGVKHFVGDIPFVWLDDDPFRGDPDNLYQLDALNYLFIPIDENDGLQQDHLDQARSWAGKAI